MFMSLLASEQTHINADFWTLMIFGGLSSCSRDDRIFIGCVRNSRWIVGVFLIPQRSKSSSGTSRRCLVFLPLEGGCLTTRSPHSIKMTSRRSLTSIPRIPTQQQLRVSTRSLLPGQLSKYFVSSSHNTSLIGYQLIGDSMIEGYILPLLHSCRSVECQSFSSRRIIILCSNWLAC